MKFLIPLISFFLGNAKNLFKEPSEALTQQVVLKIRSITVLVVVTIASLALSCVGISLLVAKFAEQLDAAGSFSWTPGLTIYLGLTVVALGTLFYSLRRDTWLKKMGFGERATRPQNSAGRPIENALALLLMDYLEERKSRRPHPSKNSDR